MLAEWPLCADLAALSFCSDISTLADPGVVEVLIEMKGK
jgi:hypothetical protein